MTSRMRWCGASPRPPIQLRPATPSGNTDLGTSTAALLREDSKVGTAEKAVASLHAGACLAPTPISTGGNRMFPLNRIEHRPTAKARNLVVAVALVMPGLLVGACASSNSS